MCVFPRCNFTRKVVLRYLGLCEREVELRASHRAAAAAASAVKLKKKKNSFTQVCSDASPYFSYLSLV